MRKGLWIIGGFAAGALLVVGVIALVMLGTGGRAGAAVARLIASETPRPPSTATATPTPQPTVTSSPTATPRPTATATSTPTPTPTPLVSITEINALGRYETLEIVMQTVVDLERQPNNIWERLCGTDKLLLIAGGEAVAGFDLAKVRPADLVVSGRSITLTLPPPEIFSHFV